MSKLYDTEVETTWFVALTDSNNPERYRESLYKSYPISVEDAEKAAIKHGYDTFEIVTKTYEIKRYQTSKEVSE